LITILKYNEKHDTVNCMQYINTNFGHLNINQNIGRNPEELKMLCILIAVILTLRQGKLNNTVGLVTGNSVVSF